MTTDGNGYPLHPSLEDARALRREERFRQNELADLPDTWTDEELAEAEAAYQAWMDWLDSPSPEQERDVLRKEDMA